MSRSGFTVKPKLRYQEKILASSVSANTADITALKFNNLVIGKTYRVFMQAALITNAIQSSPSTSAAELHAVHNGSDICAVRGSAGTGGSGTAVCFTTNTPDTSDIFVATATTVTFNFVINAGSPQLAGDGTKKNTWVRIEEVPDTASVTSAYT